MANHKGSVPDWLNAQYMEIVIKKIDEYKTAKILKVDISPGSVDGDNYVCQIFRIAVHLENNTKERTLSVIAKYKISTVLIESLEKDGDLFGTEAIFFSEMPPLFKTVLNKQNIDFFPKCFHVDLEKNIIFMEDLAPLQYQLQPRTTFLNKEQSVLVMKGLAQLHGTSYKALQIKPELKQIFEKSFFSSKKTEAMEKFGINTQKCLDKFMHSYNLPKHYLEKLSKIRETLEADWLKVCDLQEDRLNILLHGDCWKSNMLFHYTDNVVDDVKFLDFQVYNYNCFANDLQYFLFTSVSPEVIVNNLDFLLQVYFEKLRTVAPEIPNLTLDRIKKEFAERLYFGFVLTVTFRPAMTSEVPPDMEKIFDGQVVTMGFESDLYINSLQLLLPLFEKAGVF